MRIHYRNVAIADANSSAIIGGIIVAEASAANSSAVLIREWSHEYEYRRLDNDSCSEVSFSLLPAFFAFLSL